MTAPPSLPDAQEAAHRLPPVYFRHRSAKRDSARPAIRREALVVAATFAVAAILRLTLAARGWSYMNSDEGVWGLMTDDIRWHGAHPIFLYGVHYMGALQTYLAVPFFALLGPTSFALHMTTTTQFLLFLLVLYLFTRQVYSPGVAWLTLALLALGPGQAIFYEMRAAAHAQDALLFGTLVLWLTFLRLRRPERARTRLLLDLGIGLAAGIGLWCTLLTLPFTFSAGLALGVEALRSRPGQQRGRRLAGQFLALVAGLLIGAMPFIIGNVSSDGAGILEMVSASGASGGAVAAAPSGVLGHLVSLGQQAAATLLIGLPRLLGSQTVCAQCPLWPTPQSSAAPAEIVHMALISALFSLVALALWLIAAFPLGRDVWRALKHSRRHPSPSSTQGDASRAAPAWGDARWWGRAMLASGATLTVLEYAMSRSSYETPDTSMRYLVGLYLCTPLIADPLWRGSRQVWHWFQSRKRRPFANFAPRLPALLAAALLIAIFSLNIAGSAGALRESANQQTYGIPAGERDTQLLAFLQSHHITRFYTSYWVCYRLMFEAQEQVTCAALSNENAFTPGYNRVPAYVATLAATPHPAYLFDLSTHEVQPSVPTQVAQRIASGDPRFAGYTKTRVANYLIYYYVGP
ncbi:MAG TPA: hypothetical protein VF099_06950 [Ktedonobacterales bacterium]